MEVVSKNSHKRHPVIFLDKTESIWNVTASPPEWNTWQVNNSQTVSDFHGWTICQCFCFVIRDSQQPISSIRFLFLKLPPPPRAVLLVSFGLMTKSEGMKPSPWTFHSASALLPELVGEHATHGGHLPSRMNRGLNGWRALEVRKFESQLASSETFEQRLCCQKLETATSESIKSLLASPRAAKGVSSSFCLRWIHPWTYPLLILDPIGTVFHVLSLRSLTIPKHPVLPRGATKTVWKVKNFRSCNPLDRSIKVVCFNQTKDVCGMEASEANPLLCTNRTMHLGR